MDAAQALAHLTHISSQIEAAVLFDDEGVVAASTLDDGARAQALARGATELLEAAAEAGSEGRTVTQLEVATDDGSVLLVRDGARRIVATTRPDPTVGLVFYDLKSCLRDSVEEAPPAPKRTRRRKPAGEGDGDAS